jgi:hypothetical protein
MKVFVEQFLGIKHRKSMFSFFPKLQSLYKLQLTGLSSQLGWYVIQLGVTLSVAFGSYGIWMIHIGEVLVCWYPIMGCLVFFQEYG